MAEAGLTAGAFYAHFPSKAALFAEALTAGFDTTHEHHGRWRQAGEGKARVRAMLDGYLSTGHAQHPGEGCPLPPLLAELGRLDNAEARHKAEARVMGWAERVARDLGDEEIDGTDDCALGLIALCVGAVSLARAMESEAARDRVLEAARSAGAALIEGVEGGAPRA